MENTAKVSTGSLRLNALDGWIAVALLVAGNVLMPRIFHLFPSGGPTWLPIYFFTLVGACSYGWRVGLMTALLSPVLNHVLFGMPAAAVIAPIMLKSVLLAIAGGLASVRFDKFTIGSVAAVVLAAQSIGTLGEWAMVGSFTEAARDFYVGLPGILLQIFGGFAAISMLRR